MKKMFVLGFSVILITVLAGCGNLGGNNDKTLPEGLSSEEALASLAYLSAGMLSVQSPSTNVSLIGESSFARLAAMQEGETEIETNLDDVNVYLDKLKVFMDKGPDAFASVQSTESDRADYEYMISAGVEDDVYLIYYDVDPDTMELSGIIVVDGLEYVISVENSLDDKYELEVESKDEDDDEDEEDDDEMDIDIEEKITLIAYNGDDSIEVEYKYELEEDKVTTKFEMVKDIAGVESEVEIEILEENDEFKVEIEDGDNHYEFKQETEDGETVFKLEYEVNGVSGDIKIIVTQTDTGETVYRYRIEEDGKDTVEVDKPDPDDDDDEEEEDDEL